LTAGDELVITPGAQIRTSGDFIEINLDTQSDDPDPGVGAAFTYSDAVFSFGLNALMYVNTGDDDDTITIHRIAYDRQRMDINTAPATISCCWGERRQHRSGPDQSLGGGGQRQHCRR